MTEDRDRDRLADRLRALLADEPTIREQKMFGGVAFMVRDAMVAAAMRRGELLVRVAPEVDAELLERDGARRSEMGAGRSMGIGWIRVDPAVLQTDDAVTGWLGPALDRNRSTPGDADRG